MNSLNPPSGMICDETGLIGFHVTLGDFHKLEDLLIDHAIDPGTQPAYGRGIFRVLGAFRKIMMAGETPEQGFKNPALTEEDFNELRSQKKRFA